MPTPPPPVTELPDAPSRAMTDEEFVAKADAWVGAQPQFRSQLVDLGANVYDNAVEVAGSAEQVAADRAVVEAARQASLNLLTDVSTSDSTIEVSAGTKTVHTNETDRTYQVGQAVVLIRRGANDVRLYGVIATSDGSDDFTVDVDAAGVMGSGTYDDWYMVPAWLYLPGATVDELMAFASQLVWITPKALGDSMAEVELADGPNIYTDGDSELDLSKFINATVTLGGNRTLPNPTNVTVGKTGRIRVVQDGTGGRTLAFGSNWKRRRGSPATILSTAGASTYIEYAVELSNVISYSIVDLA